MASDEPRLQLLTRAQVAELLQVTVRHVQNMERRGVLKSVRVGGRVVRYRQVDIQAAIERMAQGDSDDAK